MITLSKQTKREPLLPTSHKLFDSIQDAFNSEYLNTFEDIILLSQNSFLHSVSTNAMKYLQDIYQHNELLTTFARETIKQVQNKIHMQYIMHYTSLSNAFKKYSTSYNNKASYLKLSYFLVVFFAAGFFAAALGAAFLAAGAFLVAFFAGAFTSFAAAKLTSETEIASSTRKIKSLSTFI